MRALTVLCLSVFLFVAASAAAQDEPPEPVRPALLVVDIQNKYLPMMDQSDHEMMMRMINGCIWQFRNFELPVIRVYHTDPQWGPEPGTEDFAFPESVIVTEDDPMVVKNKPSGFADTELDELLKERDVNTVFICGLSATGCVLATYFGAMERGYDTFMIEGGISSAKAAHTETIKDIVSSVGWSGLEAILKGTVKD